MGEEMEGESDEKIFVHPREIRGDKLDRRNSSE